MLQCSSKWNCCPGSSFEDASLRIKFVRVAWQYRRLHRFASREVGQRWPDGWLHRTRAMPITQNGGRHCCRSPLPSDFPSDIFERSAEAGLFDNVQAIRVSRGDAIIGPPILCTILHSEGAAQVLLRLLAKGRLPGAKCLLSMPDVHFRAYPAGASSIPSVSPVPSLRILPADGLSSRLKLLISQSFLEADRSVSTVPIQGWSHHIRVVQSEIRQIFDS